MEGHVLLLLDCCFAAQAARANKTRAIPPNVELLAASAMKVKTLRPGPLSFTTLLIKHIRAALDLTGFASISDIANALAHRGSGYTQTPIRFSGLDDSKSTVRLEPFDANPANRIQARREAAWLTLRVSLSEMLTEPLVSDIIRCFKALPSRKISKLTVEKVVLSTDSLHHFIHDSGRGGNSGPRFGQLEAPVKHEILTAWNDFTTLLAAFATQLRSSFFAADEHEATLENASGAKAGFLASLLELENGLVTVHGVVQRSVMALPELYEKREALLEAIEDRAMRDLGFVPLLNRRLKACFPSPLNDAMKMDHVIASVATGPRVFRTLIKENLEGLGPVLVEYKGYRERTTLPADTKRSKQRIQTLADLLRTRGPPEFRTLQCTRWFHDPQNQRFGLVFENPVGYDDFITLRELIQTPSSTQKPSLGQRFSVIRSIGEALLRWHTSANWVHQGIASHNILFFKPVDSPNFDYTNPYLCGFEFSRHSRSASEGVSVEDFEMNVYRHPDRQGVPREYHTKEHDLYSFGILMLEVGIWTLVGNCFDKKLRKGLTPHKMQDHIKYHARKQLSHSMGAAYERGASRCLSMEFGVERDDRVGSELAKAFENLVLKQLDSGIRLE